MTSKLSLPDCSINTPRDASNCFPDDVLDETVRMDNLSSRGIQQTAEAISDSPDQQTLMELCEEYCRGDLLPEVRMVIEEILSVNGFKCPEYPDFTKSDPRTRS